MRSTSVFRRAVAIAFVAIPLASVAGQSGPAVSSAAKPPDVKTLQLEDFARWNRITSPALSADGKWMTFTYSPNEGGQTILHVKALDGSKDYTTTVGGGAGGRAGGGGGARRCRRRQRAVVYRRLEVGGVHGDAAGSRSRRRRWWSSRTGRSGTRRRNHGAR